MTTPQVIGTMVVIASVAGFAMMALDKFAASHGLRRTRERSLLTIAAIGGWPGIWLARWVFRHKTRDRTFVPRFYLATAVNAAVVAIVIYFV